MAVVVETTSRTYIKPSSQAPPNLRIYNLSGLDQINPALYGPVILFYSAPNRPPQPDFSSILLKQSLSETLSRYYPLAGKFTPDGLSIDCCDAGVHYAEARIVNPSSFSLSQLKLTDLKSLFPIAAVENILSPPPPGSPVLLLQVTSFPCGGASIGVLAAHNVLDAFSIGCFLRAWAWAAAGAQILEPAIWNPKFGAESIFPRNDRLILPRSVSPGPATAERRNPAVTRRFVFDALALARLKEKLTTESIGYNNNNNNVAPISRVLAVTALLCESILRAFSPTTAEAVVVTQTVNLRGRGNPPLPSNSIGNYIINAVATIEPREIKNWSDLVKLLRDSVGRRIGGGFPSKIQGRAGAALLAEAAREEDSGGGRRRITFTSWSRLGLYEADFGWGKPTWIGCLPSHESDGGGGGGVVDFVLIVDTRDGSGLEAWVFLAGDEMNMLENDEKLLSFASLDPSPISGTFTKSCI